MKLTNFQIKLAWVVGIGSIICIWIAFPYIFKTLLSFYTFPDDFNQFGAFGDIYGSLNTLISSIALCAVAFSTWLQVTSLKEVREANQRQESITRYEVFLNQLHSLLNYKNERVKGLSIYNGTEYISEFKVFNAYRKEISDLLQNDWKEKCHILKAKDIRQNFNKISKNLNNGEFYYELSNYYNIYTQILILIDSSYLDKKQLESALQLVRATMTLSEQVVMFFIAPIKPQLFDIIDGKEIFNTFYHQKYFGYAEQFYDESFFKLKKWKSQLHVDINAKPPT